MNEIKSFADRCDLELVDRGEPDILCTKDWYDDEAQAWMLETPSEYVENENFGKKYVSVA